MAKATAVRVVKSNLPANIDAEMAAEAAEMKKRINAPSGDKIKTKGKTFTMPDGSQGEELDCIIVEFVTAHKYYPNGYIEGQPTPPSCFSITLEQAGMTPSENAIDKQCESCAGCWANQYKSGANGKGKACKNERLLAILPLDADAETPLAILEITPTALQSFDGVVQKASNAGKPLRAFVTRLSFADETYASVRFELVSPAEKDLMMMAQSRKGEAMTRLTVEPDMSSLIAANDSGKKAGARKPVSKMVRRA